MLNFYKYKCDICGQEFISEDVETNYRIIINVEHNSSSDTAHYSFPDSYYTFNKVCKGCKTILMNQIKDTLSKLPIE